MKRNLFILVALLSLTLSACGAAGPSSTINVTMTDFQFTPKEFTIPAGQEITVDVVNNGAVIHEFVIMKSGQTVGDKFDDEDEANIYWEVELQPGASTTATFTAPADPGDYQLVCGTAGHLEAGMIGKIIVVAGE
jgi:uncharacterized cupredoxin-like copper-binding protein